MSPLMFSPFALHPPLAPICGLVGRFIDGLPLNPLIRFFILPICPIESKLHPSLPHLPHGHHAKLQLNKISLLLCLGSIFIVFYW